MPSTQNPLINPAGKTTPRKPACGLLGLTGSLIWLLLTMPLLGQNVRAEFKLTSSTLKAGSKFRAVVKYQAETESLIGGDAAFLPPAPGEDPDGIWVERVDPPKDSVTSCLLATPDISEFDPKDWTVRATAGKSADGSATTGIDVQDAVTLKPVEIGSLRGIQVLVDSERARGADTIDIYIEGPAPSVARDLRRLPITQYPIAARLAKTAFLNGSEVTTVPARTNKSTAKGSLPSPQGIFRINYDPGDALMKVSLAEIGANTSNWTELLLRHHGTEIPVGGLIGDNLWFYAPRRVTASGATDSIFATPNSASGSPVMPQRSAFGNLLPKGTEVAIERVKTFDWNQTYDRLVNAPIGERFFFFRVQSTTSSLGNTLEYVSLPVYDRLADANVDVSLTIWGRNASNANPDHFADITLEGISFPQTSFEGRAKHVFNTTATFGSLNTPSHWTLRYFVPPFPGGLDAQMLDVIELGYLAKPRVGEDLRARINLPEAPSGQPRRITVGGFPSGTASSDVILLDVTDNDHPIRLSNPPVFPDETGGVAIEFEAPSSPSTFFVQTLDSLTTPLLVTQAEEMPPLPESTETLNRFVIRPDSLAEAMEPYLTLRGSGSYVFTPQQAYNAYNGGQESPEAIQAALRDVYSSVNMRAPLPSVLLVGHGSYDAKNFLGLQEGAQLPFFIEKSVETNVGNIENSADYHFGLLAGDDDFLDAMVSRIPAKYPEDVTKYLNKLNDFESLLPGYWSSSRPGLIVIDDDPLFQNDSSLWVDLWEDTGRPANLVEIGEASNGAAESAAVKSAMEDPSGGAAFVLYMGHGNIDTWAGEVNSVIRSNQIANLNTENRLPFVTTFTCLNHNFALPGSTTQSLGEAWLFTEDRGGIASISPCTVDFYFEERQFATHMFGFIAQPPTTRPRTIGEVYMLSQITFLAEHPNFFATIRGFTLFGDPEVNMGLNNPNQFNGVEDWFVF